MFNGLAERHHSHRVIVYRRDSDWVEAASSWLAAGLHTGVHATVVIDPERQVLLQAVLAANGVDVGAAVAHDDYESFDVDTAVDAVLASADPAGLARVVDGMFAPSDAGPGGSPGSGIRVLGEVAAALLLQGQAQPAVELERLCTELIDARPDDEPADLLCLYAFDRLQHLDLAVVRELVEAHTEVSAPTSPEWWPPLPPPEAGGQYERVELFVGGRECVATVRRFVSDSLLPGHDRNLVLDCVLVASELATNAILHSGSAPFRVTLSRSSTAVRIAVEDTTVAPPSPMSATANDEHGRGVRIIGTLADRWGMQARAQGKVVWAEMIIP